MPSIRTLEVLKWLCTLAICVNFAIACDEHMKLNKTAITFKNLPFIKANINGSDGYLLIDTGASKTTLSKAVAKQLNLKVDSTSCIAIKNVVGDIAGYQAKDTIALNIGKTKALLYVTIAPIDSLLTELSNTIDKQVIGILGCDFLHTAEALVDLRTKQLYILKK